MAFCACSTTLSNTGTPNSQRIIDVGSKLFVVPLFADDGTQNGIANTDTLDQTYLDAWINNDDPSKRLYPLPPFVDVVSQREASEFQEYSDGTRSKTRNGRKPWSGRILSHSSAFLAKLKSFSCHKFGVYRMDDCGRLVGRESGTNLFPITVNETSWDPILVESSPTDRGGIDVTFDFAQSMKDEHLRQVIESEISGEWYESKGLRDVTAVSSAPAVDGNVMTMTLPFDAFLGASPHPAATGWVTADFNDIYNTTTSLAVTLTSATEGADGVYTLVWPTQTSGDVLRLRSNKDGFWYEINVTIP